jgi:membrane-associated phospholipid phosphatase
MYPSLGGLARRGPRLLCYTMAMSVCEVVSPPNEQQDPVFPESPALFSRPYWLTMAAGTCALAGLAAIASRKRPNHYDIAITRRFQRHVAPPAAKALRLISSPGYAPFTHSVVISLAGCYWALGYRREAIFSIGTMGAGFSTGILKLSVRRPRPDVSFRMHHRLLKDNSFPSGHATHYTVFYGYVAFLAARYLPACPLRAALLAYCSTLIACVGPSRVYLGHHWASDVAAGQLVGGLYLLTMLQAYLAFEPLPPLPCLSSGTPHVVEKERGE